jgi:hypothetical protein
VYKKSGLSIAHWSKIKRIRLQVAFFPPTGWSMAIEELVLRGSGLVPDFKELQFEGSPTYRFPFHCISQKSLYLPKITISATHQFFQSELLDPKLPIMEHDFRTRLDGREASGNFVFMKNCCLNPRSHRKRDNLQLGYALA